MKKLIAAVLTAAFVLGMVGTASAGSRNYSSQSCSGASWSNGPGRDYYSGSARTGYNQGDYC